METWVQLPTAWIREGNDYFLKSLTWTQAGTNSHNTAALMVLLAIATNISHRETRKNPIVGAVELSYTDLAEITSLSRKLVSEGIKKLVAAGLIEVHQDKKVNQYVISNTTDLLGEKMRWGKLPAKILYEENLGSIKAFRKHFKLRSKVELNALKLYFLIVAFRNKDTNLCTVSYETISKYTGILRNDISSSVSFLVSCELIRVTKVESINYKNAVSNVYRLVGIESYKYKGAVDYEAS